MICATISGNHVEMKADRDGMLNFINYRATQPFYDIFDDQTTKHDATLRLLVNKTSWTINDGLSLTEACVTFPVLSALAEGFEVYVVGDACGGLTPTRLRRRR